MAPRRGLRRGTMAGMGSFLDHLEDAERQRRSEREREHRERAEIRIDYTRRSAARPRESIKRSSPPRSHPADEET